VIRSRKIATLSTGWLHPNHVAFRDDGAEVAHVEISASSVRLFVDGAPVHEAPVIQNLRYLGRDLAYVERLFDGRWRLVVGATKEQPRDVVAILDSSADGRRLLRIAGDEVALLERDPSGAWREREVIASGAPLVLGPCFVEGGIAFVVREGALLVHRAPGMEPKRHPSPAGSIPLVALSANGRHFAFVSFDRSERVVIDGAAGEAFDAVLLVRVANDGRVVYLAQRDGRRFIVDRGRVAFETREWIDSIALSDDGSRFAYSIARGARLEYDRGRWPYVLDGDWQIVCDGVAMPIGKADLVSELRFSPNHLFWIARLAAKSFCGFGDAKSDRVDEVYAPRFEGRVVRFGARVGLDLWWYELTV
jgi:hypothetical protein